MEMSIPSKSWTDSFISSFGFVSVVLTIEPLALRNFTVANPVRASPTTKTFFPLRSISSAINDNAKCQSQVHHWNVQISELHRLSS